MPLKSAYFQGRIIPCFMCGGISVYIRTLINKYTRGLCDECGYEREDDYNGQMD